MNDDSYLIWSHEHSAWWATGGHGYHRRLTLAARFSREQAMDICVKAMPGTAAHLGALPELPVREADVKEMLARYPFTVGLESVL